MGKNLAHIACHSNRQGVILVVQKTEFNSTRTYITKTRIYRFDLLKPHFYTLKLGLTGEHINFLISAQNIDCGYSLELPDRDDSNMYHNLCFEQKYENFLNFHLKVFIFLW